MSAWTKLAPIGAVHSGCNLCESKPETLPLTKVLAVGFGQVAVTKGDECVWAGDDPNVTLASFEQQAALDPDHDWRVHFNAPLWDGTWQRHGEGEWVAVERGMGFA